MLLEICAAIGAKLERAQRTGVFDFLSVMPRTQHKKNFVVVGVFGFDGLVHRWSSIDIFLIPQAVHQHDRNFQRLTGENSVHGLLAPERVVAGMVKNFSPEAHLFKTVPAAQFACRTRLHEEIVIVVVVGPPFCFVVAGADLLKNVRHVLLAEGAIVKPVVTHPAIHHGIHGHADL